MNWYVVVTLEYGDVAPRLHGPFSKTDALQIMEAINETSPEGVTADALQPEDDWSVYSVR